MNAIIDQQRQAFPRYKHIELLDPTAASDWDMGIARLRDDIEAADAALDNRFDTAMVCIDRLYREIGGGVREIANWLVDLRLTSRVLIATPIRILVTACLVASFLWLMSLPGGSGS